MVKSIYNLVYFSQCITCLIGLPYYNPIYLWLGPKRLFVYYVKNNFLEPKKQLILDFKLENSKLKWVNKLLNKNQREEMGKPNRGRGGKDQR